MRNTSSIADLLTTNCLTVDSAADVALVREIFSQYPLPFIPVLEGCRFAGIIFREEMLSQSTGWPGQPFHITDFISKEIVVLSIHNTPEEAKEVFDANVFDLIPVVDDDGDLMGLLMRDDVEDYFENSESEAILTPAFRKIMSFLS